jgi:predicted TIM-barrel fold metal-dependent hydrolase
MIVDCHTHISSSGEGDSFSEYISVSKAVERTIVLSQPGNPDEVNGRVSEFIKDNKSKMAGFAFVDPIPETITAKHLNNITRKKGLSGAVVYCSACGFHPAHSRAMRFYEAAEELGIPVFFHNGPVLGAEAIIEYAQPVLLDEIARTFTGLKMVIGDMGLPFVGQTLAVIARQPNVYADLTINTTRPWEVYNTVVAAYEQKVMNKLLFGSGFPLGRADESIELLLGFNRMLGETNLPVVARSEIRNIIDCDAISILGIEIH